MAVDRFQTTTKTTNKITLKQMKEKKCEIESGN
jgi:hypothetical protein